MESSLKISSALPIGTINMSTNVTSMWTGISTTSSNIVILPDGCRDLIVKIKEGHAPTWYVSPLFDQAKVI